MATRLRPGYFAKANPFLRRRPEGELELRVELQGYLRRARGAAAGLHVVLWHRSRSEMATQPNRCFGAGAHHPLPRPEQAAGAAVPVGGSLVAVRNLV